MPGDKTVLGVYNSVQKWGLLKQKLLILLFAATFAVLIIETFLNVKDVNDEWILQGILPYFILFVITYSANVSYFKNPKYAAALTAIFLIAASSIPNIKYSFIYGYFDILPHYGFAQEIIRLGVVPTTAFYSGQYGPAPGLHIFLSSLALISGSDAAYSLKVFLSLFPAVFPLAVYFMVRKSGMSEIVSRVTIVSTALVAPVTYPFTGTSATFFLYMPFLYIGILVSLYGKNLLHVRSFLVADLLFAVAIIACHDATTFLLLSFFLFIFIISIFRKAIGKYSSALFPSFIALGFTLTALAHFIFSSDLNLNRFLTLITSALESLLQGSKPLAPSYYEGFYQLSILGKVTVYVIKWGMYSVAAFLTILALVLLMRCKNTELRKFYSSLILFLLFPPIVLFLSLFVRAFNDRFVYYFLAFAPFFVGFAIFRIIYSKHRRFNDALFALAIFSLILVTMLQRFPCQPLIPEVSTEYGNFVAVDWRQTNTVYDRSLIGFASDHIVTLRVTTDNPMRWQIYGLTNMSFQTLLTWESPGVGVPVNAPIVLVSETVQSHVIASGRDSANYHEYVHVAIEENDILYTNGQSYLLFNFTSLNRD